MATTMREALREIHRLRRSLRDLQSEIENLPRVKKAHQAKVAKQEQALKDAQDHVKHLKAAVHDSEVNLKSTHQQLQKYERQMNDLKSPKEVEAMQKEIAEAKVHVGELEEKILNGITEVEEQAAKVPAVEALVKKAKAEFATFEAEANERRERLQREIKLAEEELKQADAKIPAANQADYARLIKAFGADALAMIKERDRTCSQCQNSITLQNINELKSDRFLCCSTCGRMLYLVES